MSESDVEYLRRIAPMARATHNDHIRGLVPPGRALLNIADRMESLLTECSKWKERCESLANFNPDWDMLEAAQQSLREHMTEIKRQKWITERVATLLISKAQPDYERALAQAEYESTAEQGQANG